MIKKQPTSSRNAALSARATLYTLARQRNASVNLANIGFEIRLRFIKVAYKKVEESVLTFPEAQKLALSAWELFDGFEPEDYMYCTEAIELSLLQGRVPTEIELNTLYNYLKDGV